MIDVKNIKNAHIFKNIIFSSRASLSVIFSPINLNLVDFMMWFVNDLI